MHSFTLFWLSGTKETVTGNDIADALTKAGHGGGAVKALDFYATDKAADNYVWDKKTHTWTNPKIIEKAEYLMMEVQLE